MDRYLLVDDIVYLKRFFGRSRPMVVTLAVGLGYSPPALIGAQRRDRSHSSRDEVLVGHWILQIGLCYPLVQWAGLVFLYNVYDTGKFKGKSRQLFINGNSVKIQPCLAAFMPAGPSDVP